jgi:hypothetical protein
VDQVGGESIAPRLIARGIVSSLIPHPRSSAGLILGIRLKVLSLILREVCFDNFWASLDLHR